MPAKVAHPKVSISRLRREHLSWLERRIGCGCERVAKDVDGELLSMLGAGQAARETARHTRQGASTTEDRRAATLLRDVARMRRPEGGVYYW